MPTHAARAPPPRTCTSLPANRRVSVTSTLSPPLDDAARTAASAAAAAARALSSMGDGALRAAPAAPPVLPPAPALVPPAPPSAPAPLLLAACGWSGAGEVACALAGWRGLWLAAPAAPAAGADDVDAAPLVAGGCGAGGAEEGDGVALGGWVALGSMPRLRIHSCSQGGQEARLSSVQAACRNAAGAHARLSWRSQCTACHGAHTGTRQLRRITRIHPPPVHAHTVRTSSGLRGLAFAAGLALEAGPAAAAGGFPLPAAGAAGPGGLAAASAAPGAAGWPGLLFSRSQSLPILAFFARTRGSDSSSGASASSSSSSSPAPPFCPAPWRRGEVGGPRLHEQEQRGAARSGAHGGCCRLPMHARLPCSSPGRAAACHAPSLPSCRLLHAVQQCSRPPRTSCALRPPYRPARPQQTACGPPPPRSCRWPRRSPRPHRRSWAAARWRAWSWRTQALLSPLKACWAVEGCDGL